MKEMMMNKTKIPYLIIPVALSITSFAFASEANFDNQSIKEPVYVEETETIADNINDAYYRDMIEERTVSNNNQEQDVNDNSKNLTQNDDNSAVFTSEEVTKKPEKKKKIKKKKKTKLEKIQEEYSDYLIKDDAYLPVGDASEKEISIQGSISKTELLSLADCIDIAMRNNPKIQAAYANVSVVKENKVQAISAFTPSISSTTGISRIKPDTSAMPNANMSNYTKYLLGTISISEMVYDFGASQNLYTISKIDWEVSKQNVDSVVNSIVCDVKDAYYNLLYAISAKQVRLETVEEFELMYKQAHAFYEVGTRPKVDVTIAAANLADARANYIEASNAVDLAISRLNNIMGTPFIEPYTIDTSIPFQETDVTMRGAVEIANKARPDMKIALAEIERANQYVKYTKKSYFPQLSVAADLSMGGRKNFTDKSWYTFGGYLNFPVINPVSVVSQIKQAKAELQKQQYDTTSAINDIYYEIQTSYVMLTDARQRMNATKAALKEAKESFELSQGRYKAGVCDAIELKEAQITYENAKLAYISNIYTYNSAKASLEKAIGQSLPAVDLEESVEI